MAGVEEPNKRWEAIAARPIARDMSFDGDFLLLGAQTHLANVGATLDEPRLVALLAAAHGCLVEASSLRQITRALEKKRDGRLVLALIHLALSGVAKLRDPKEDSRRLFLADALMAEGVDPSVIIRGLGLDLPPDDALRKYSPDQPRVPAGNPDSGQWTREDGSGSAGAGPHADSARPEDVSATPGSARTASPGVDPVSGPRLPDATTPDQSLPVGEAAYHGDFHDAVRDDFADALTRGGNTVLKEVTITLPGDRPMTAKIDILARNPTGCVFGIEVKTGDDPTFTDAQRIVYPHVEAGDIVISNDPRLGALMFTPGVPWPHVDLFVLYASGPGAPLEVRPMLQYMQQ